MSPTTPIVLDRSSDVPLYRQIEDQLRSAIRDGRVRPGALLPGVRTLAGALGVARITVATAYDQLAAEGYVDGRVGSGTRVSTDPPGTEPRASGAPASPSAPPAGSSPPIRHANAPDRGPIDLRPDAARLDDFPFVTWERLLRDAVRELAASRTVATGEPGGDPVLREVLAARLGASRGLACDPSRIIVSTGDWAAVSTIADAVPGPAAPAVVEDPGPGWIRDLLAARGRRIVPVPVDGEGIRTDRLPPSLGAPVGLDILVLVTPAWGAVLGGTLPPERRRELLARLGRTVRIVEDDRDGELRLEGPPPPALASQDPLGRVLHVRGLERDLHPGARLGYLVVPESDVERYTSFVAPQGRGPGIIEQRTLARFIESGQFDRHLRRLRRRLIGRQAALIDALDRVAPGRLVGVPAQAGRHIVVRVVDPRLDASRIVARAESVGVRLGPALGDAFIVGFGGEEPDRIIGAVRRVARAIDAEEASTDDRTASPIPGVIGVVGRRWTAAAGAPGYAIAGPHERRHQP